jgi:hypothetical protein
MGEPIPLGRACGRCGERVRLTVDTDGGVYNDDLEALFDARSSDLLLVEAHCGCDRPRAVALEAALRYPD